VPLYDASLANMEAGLREARRFLKDGSLAVFVDVIEPADPVLDTHLQTFALLRDAWHVRDYTLAEWIAALARSGFSMESTTLRKLHLKSLSGRSAQRRPPNSQQPSALCRSPRQRSSGGTSAFQGMAALISIPQPWW